MAYTDIDKPTDYFESKIWTGNGSSQNISLDFAPNWVWIKQRSGTRYHNLQDTIRGTGLQLFSNATSADNSDSTNITAFNSDGYSLGAGQNVNNSSSTYVGWSWKAGTSFTNDASGTGIGSIDSAGSASTASGFSIVSWTGTGSAGTIAHGLGKLPKMIIAKQRNTARNWVVYFLDTTIANNNVNNYLELDTTAASTGDSGGRWGSYANYSTTTFGVGTDNGTNQSGGTYIAYVFSDIKAFSKIGKYVGNGNADGTFVYTGFKPAFVMWKKTNGASEWIMVDSKRNTSNEVDKLLRANQSSAENTYGACDFLSNGWKFRDGDTDFQASGDTYLYMAFAENPFVTSTGVPATAR